MTVASAVLRPLCRLQFAKNGEIINEEDSRVRGAVLRAQATNYIRKHPENFMPVFCKDQDITPSQDAVDQQKAMKAWLEAMAEPHTWIEGLTLYAISCKLGTPLVV